MTICVCMFQFMFKDVQQAKVNVVFYPLSVQACYKVQYNRRAQEGVDAAGVDTDYVLYVSAVNTASCAGTVVAYARHCQLERALDRSRWHCFINCDAVSTFSINYDFLVNTTIEITNASFQPPSAAFLRNSGTTSSFARQLA